MFIAGVRSVQRHQLTRQAYKLLNKNIDPTLVENLIDSDVLHVFQTLQNSVIIIKPVTHVLSDEIEDQGKENYISIFLTFLMLQSNDFEGSVLK